MNGNWRVIGCALIAILLCAGCSGSASATRAEVRRGARTEIRQGARAESESESVSYRTARSDNGSVAVSSSDGSYDFDSAVVSGDMASAEGAAPQPQPQPQPQPSGGAPAAPGQSDQSGARKPAETRSNKAPLLIYDGTVILALYDVETTQKEVIALVEAQGGYVSTRSNAQLVLRVPAGKFRDLLDKIAGFGDLLDLRWQARDVTEAVRDTKIRLDSALAMRERLELLLQKAEKVEDALAIERQLSRVILEIEQLQAALRGYQDRIAYSTITVEFRAKKDREIPNNEYSLPFSWLDGLGVQRLMRIPRVNR